MNGLVGIIIFLPLLAGLFFPLVAGRLGVLRGLVALAFPVISFAGLVAAAVQAGSSPHELVVWPWIPSMGISLSFLIDGLSLLFGLIVSGVGILVFFYSLFYFKGDEEGQGRFYSYMLLFMAAMLGTVLSDNLLVLFIFWELTGITSFFLIGFLHDKASSRAGARMALLVTVLTGLFMLVGILMLRQATGTFSISEIQAMGVGLPVDGALFNAIVVLFLLGAFGKSAQFPFHFWLPRAMEAPTPVSAYLHSATMVKLGVFLVARMFSSFSEAVLWMPILTIFGFGTMVLAAFLALRSNALKAILAFSTVTQLGYLIGLYGLMSAIGVFADFYHILDHVFYKACLFMMVGVVTAATGIKDIRELGGLFRRMPLLGIATAIACASMAGFPLTMGFVAKEMLLEDFSHLLANGPWFVWVAFGCLALATVFKIAFSLRLLTGIFFGPEPEGMEERFRAPSIWFQLPPILLAGMSLVFGLVLVIPQSLIDFLHVEGFHGREGYLALWHGVNLELATSLAMIAGGLCLFVFGRQTGWSWTWIPKWLQFDEAWESLILWFNKFTKDLTRILRSESPQDYLPVMISVMVLILGGFLLEHFETSTGAAFVMADWKFEGQGLRIFVAGVIGLASLGVIFLTRWTSQLILLSAAGFLTTFYFVLYRAPDLALTQILVESATLILVLALLSRFPKSAQRGEDTEILNGGRNVMNAVISVGLGLVVTAMILVANAVPPKHRLGQAILEQTVEQAEGSNAVNTILVDFRGFDTLGEISVLVIAVLGAIGLFFRYKRSDRERAQRAMGAPGFGIFHSQPKAPAGEETS